MWLSYSSVWRCDDALLLRLLWSSSPDWCFSFGFCLAEQVSRIIRRVASLLEYAPCCRNLSRHGEFGTIAAMLHFVRTISLRATTTRAVARIRISEFTHQRSQK